MRTMKVMRLLLVLLAIPHLAATCRQAAPEGRSSAARPGVASGPVQERSGAGDVVLGHLKVRDKLVTVRDGPEGPLYTVTSEDGAVLATDLSQAELSAQFPEVGETIEKGLAEQGTALGLK